MGTTNIVLCGLGGQGILFMTKVLAQVALDKGLNIMCAETHGMAQRGGSVVSHLRIGQVESSLVRTGTAHFLLALDETEAYRNLPFLSEGAGMYVSTPAKGFPRQETIGFLEKNKIVCYAMPAAATALELGAPLSANLALLGYFSAFGEGPVSKEELRGTLSNITPDHVRESNLKVFDTGLERGLAEKGE